MDLNSEYLNKEILTYIGNKRSLLREIDDQIAYVSKELKKDKLVTADLFSGSGIVSRLLKEHSSFIVSNDLEAYSKVINECFLSNGDSFDIKYYNELLKEINHKIQEKPISGIITKMYSPKNEYKISKSDRVFYTKENALFIDSFRYYIDLIVPNSYKKYFLALLLIESSIHVNTSGVFKGFYKDKTTGVGKFGGKAENALSRIKGKIEIGSPIFSENKCDFKVFQEDSLILSKKIKKMDLVYLDPPYNQHPYGSNYFMLNVILNNKEPSDVSEVSGIPKNWNHSKFNKSKDALTSLEQVVKNLDSKFILISYNNEGFIKYDELVSMLKKYGSIKVKSILYNTFRGSRNLNERNIHTSEFLFLLRKD